MDIDNIVIRHLDLTDYEKSLLNSKDLLAVITANTTAEGYYINKAGEKVFVIEDKVSGYVYVACARKNEDGGEYILSSTFNEDDIPDDTFERDHTMLPMECIGYCKSKWFIPIKVHQYEDNEKGIYIMLQWRGNSYDSYLDQNFVKEIEEIRYRNDMLCVIIGEVVVNFFEAEIYKR